MCISLVKYMTSGEITTLLKNHIPGDNDSLNAVYTALYSEIKAIAGHQLKSLNPGQTITPTVLANECYLKLAGLSELPPTDKRHFMRYLAKSMRRYLIDCLRQKHSAKRNVNRSYTGLSQFIGDDNIEFRLLDIDRLLDLIEEIDSQSAEILHYKLIFNFTYPEIAELMNLSERHVIRLWQQARALLLTLVNEQARDEH